MKFIISSLTLLVNTPHVFIHQLLQPTVKLHVYVLVAIVMTYYLTGSRYYELTNIGI